MVYVSALLLGLAVCLLSFLALQRQQRKAQRDSIKSRLLAAPATQEDTPLYQKLPFIRILVQKQKAQQTARRTEAELPRMLDILAMGMHAGLSFDAAFGLYVLRFDTELAQLCRERFEIWERGLISRSEGLEQLAARLDIPVFDQFCRTASRSLRHGIPMGPLIREYAEQARKEYRNKQKELVLKAPVKMLLPTGTLILPAMLLLVIGPIILDVTERMV
ncbi:MAG: type II secretion system F family protein [Coriobacteriales bacterium]|jgi:tight adherence protein C|nr:type II secretion system F family protein [Coriobacteriales bacterium]